MEKSVRNAMHVVINAEWDTRTKSRSDIMMRCCLPETGGSKGRRVDESTDEVVCEEKSGSFFFGNPTCKLAKVRHGKAHTRMKRATDASDIASSMNGPLVSGVITSINTVLNSNLMVALSGSCPDSIDGLIKVVFLCSQTKPMTRSLANDSSFEPKEYLKGQGPCRPEIGYHLLLQISAVARLIFVSPRAWFPRGIGGRVDGFLLEGCRSIPLTKRLPIAPAERVNRQPSFSSKLSTSPNVSP